MMILALAGQWIVEKRNLTFCEYSANHFKYRLHRVLHFWLYIFHEPRLMTRQTARRSLAYWRPSSSPKTRGPECCICYRYPDASGRTSTAD